MKNSLIFCIALLVYRLDVISSLRPFNLTYPLNNNKNPPVITIPLIPHAVVVRERRLQAGDTIVERPSYRSKYHHPSMRESASLVEAVPMVGLLPGSYGTPYVDVWCGTPPQRQTLIVDTGRRVTAFPCHAYDGGVDHHHHVDGLTLDETSSTSFQKLCCAECELGNCAAGGSCILEMRYSEDSSWSAFEASDLCYLGGGLYDRPTSKKDNGNPDDDDSDPFHAAPNFTFSMKFGCQTHITGLFSTQLADGILGMNGANSAFWYQMYEAGVIPAQSFSLCFSRLDDEADSKRKETGAMTLGGTDERWHNTPLVYTPMEESLGFYVVHVRKMYLRAGGTGGMKIVQLDLEEGVLNAGRVIVDSGTTVRFCCIFPPLYWLSLSRFQKLLVDSTIPRSMVSFFYYDSTTYRIPTSPKESAKSLATCMND